MNPRSHKATVVISYIAMTLALAFCVRAWIGMGDLQAATYDMAHACFLVLLGIWMHVCS